MVSISELRLISAYFMTSSISQSCTILSRSFLTGKSAYDLILAILASAKKSTPSSTTVSTIFLSAVNDLVTMPISSPALLVSALMALTFCLIFSKLITSLGYIFFSPLLRKFYSKTLCQ